MVCVVHKNRCEIGLQGEERARPAPEKGVVLHADLPQPLRRTVVQQLESDRALELFKLKGAEKQE